MEPSPLPDYSRSAQPRQWALAVGTLVVLAAVGSVGVGLLIGRGVGPAVEEAPALRSRLVEDPSGSLLELSEPVAAEASLLVTDGDEAIEITRETREGRTLLRFARPIEPTRLRLRVDGRLVDIDAPSVTAPHRPPTLSARAPRMESTNLARVRDVWYDWNESERFVPGLADALELSSDPDSYVLLDPGDRPIESVSLGATGVPFRAEPRGKLTIPLEFGTAADSASGASLSDQLLQRAVECHTRSSSQVVVWLIPTFDVLSCVRPEVFGDAWRLDRGQSVLLATDAVRRRSDYVSLHCNREFRLAGSLLFVRLQCRGLAEGLSFGLQVTTHLRVLPVSTGATSVSVDAREDSRGLRGEQTAPLRRSHLGSRRQHGIDLPGVPEEVTRTEDWFEWQLVVWAEGSVLHCGLSLLRPRSRTDSAFRLLARWEFGVDALTENLLYKPEIQNCHNPALQVQAIRIACVDTTTR